MVVKKCWHCINQLEKNSEYEPCRNFIYTILFYICPHLPGWVGLKTESISIANNQIFLGTFCRHSVFVKTCIDFTFLDFILVLRNFSFDTGFHLIIWYWFTVNARFILLSLLILLLSALLLFLHWIVFSIFFKVLFISFRHILVSISSVFFIFFSLDNSL